MIRCLRVTDKTKWRLRKSCCFFQPAFTARTASSSRGLADLHCSLWQKIEREKSQNCVDTRSKRAADGRPIRLMFAVHSSRRWGMIGANSSIHNPSRCERPRRKAAVHLPRSASAQAVVRLLNPQQRRPAAERSGPRGGSTELESTNVMVQGSADLIESCHVTAPSASYLPPAFVRPLRPQP